MNYSDVLRQRMLGLPIIQSVEDLSRLSHISKGTIFKLSFHAEKYYKVFTVKKPSGRIRTIHSPSKMLKGLQAWILVNILNKLKVSDSCKGFERGTSISDNAKSHVSANALLTVDLHDFFDTIKGEQIFTIFRSIGYNSLISTVLTNICIVGNCLPQGGPCSPKLSNLVAWKLDLRIQGYVGKRDINYTRYADDLSFSSLNPGTLIHILPMIKTIVTNEGFVINSRKTRMSGTARAKVITGLVLYDDTYGVGKEKFKEFRSKVHHLTLPREQGNIELVNHIRGWLAYLKSVDEKRAAKAQDYILLLVARFPSTLVTKLIKS